MPTTYIHFTTEQKEQARQTDLVSFLRNHGEILKRSGSEYEWRHGSEKITLRSNVWFHQYEREGGDAIDFVRRFYNLDYPEAVSLLLSENGIRIEPQEQIRHEKKPFALPPAHSDMRRVYAYLLKQRYIDRDVIYHFTHNKLLYEDAEHHNAVFVGLDENGNPCHAHKRGTYSDSSYKGNIDGSNPDYSFHHVGCGNSLFVFEAPIDMLSYISLHKNNWQTHSYVALCCTSPQAAVQILKSNPQIDTVYTCLDHDKAGIEGNFRIAEAVNRHGKYKLVRIQSKFKDWNESLKAQHGIVPIPAEEHIGMEKIKNLCRELIKSCEQEKCPAHPLSELGEQYEKLERLNPKQVNKVREQSTQMSGIAFLFAKKQITQLGRSFYESALLRLYHPHHDNGGYKSHLSEVKYSLKGLSDAFAKDEVLPESAVLSRIKDTLQLSVDCLRLAVCAELTEEKEQRRSEDECQALQP